MELQYELSNETKESLKSVVDSIIKAFKNLYQELKKIADATNRTFSIYLEYILKMEPRKRYKYLKSIGIKDYIPFFNYNGMYHCRNNC